MTSLQPVVSIAAVVSAGMTILGHYLHPPRPLIIGSFKPITTVLILVIALLPGSFASDPYARLIAIGLIFCLFGDILLVLPHDRFLFGLGAFLIGLLFYALAFRSGAAGQGFPLVMLALAVIAALILRYLWSGLSSALQLPVALYVGTITLMAALAVGRALRELSPGTLLAAIGAVLFMASDATLAVNRFRRPFRLAPAAVLGTYFAAQLLIALSV